MPPLASSPGPSTAPRNITTIQKELTRHRKTCKDAKENAAQAFLGLPIRYHTNFQPINDPTEFLVQAFNALALAKARAYDKMTNNARALLDITITSATDTFSNSHTQIQSLEAEKAEALAAERPLTPSAPPKENPQIGPDGLPNYAMFIENLTDYQPAKL